MAVITRYFSTTSAGAGDGTTWADRAALFSAGNWSSVISGFNFTSDSLICYVEGGKTYSCSQSLTTSVTGTPDPTISLVLWIVACDNSGNLLPLPDPTWTADKPIWNSSTMPVIATTTNIATASLTGSMFYNIKFIASGRTGGPVLTGAIANWCIVVNTTSGINTQGISGSSLYNVAVQMNTNTYDSALNCSGNQYLNCRAEGGSAGGSGNRYGVSMTSNSSFRMVGCAVVNNPGVGIALTNTGTSVYIEMDKCVVANNGSDGINIAATTGTSTPLRFSNSIITGNGGYGINRTTGTEPIYIQNSRFRDNASGNWNDSGSVPTVFAYTNPSTDALEYADVSSGDFRIKPTATIATLGFGISVKSSSGGCFTFIS